jgi:hypothetical protein
MHSSESEFDLPDYSGSDQGVPTSNAKLKGDENDEGWELPDYDGSDESDANGEHPELASESDWEEELDEEGQDVDESDEEWEPRKHSSTPFPKTTLLPCGLLGELKQTIHNYKNRRRSASNELEELAAGNQPLPRQDRRKGHWYRISYDWEEKARAVAFFDSLPKKNVNGDRKDREHRTALHILPKGRIEPRTGGTVAKWVTAEGRALISAMIFPHNIADYANGKKPKNKGGRGKRAPGRGLYRQKLPGRRACKYPLSEEQTLVWCRALRKRGSKLTTRLVRAKMLFFTRNHYGDVPFKASGGWMKRFMGRYGLTWRRRNDNAKKSTASLVGPMSRWINRLRLYRLNHPTTDPATDTKFGKFGLNNTFNVDQVPLPFASADPRTLEFIGTKRVWVKQPGSGLDKRQCTLQLLIRPLGKQPKPVLIFRGAVVPKRACDRRKRELEVARYDPDVTVIWQLKAWADTTTCIKWANTCMKSFVDEELGEDAECLLLADSLRSQVKQEFQDTVKSAVRADVLFGVKGGSHIWQPVDHHIGAAYHRMMDASYVDWMASDADAYGDNSVPVGDRRILLTQWAGAAYRALEETRKLREAAMVVDPAAKPSIFYSAFRSTGSLVTRDGTDDNYIRPHSEIVGELEEQFRNGIRSPAELLAEHERALREHEDFIIELSESTSDGSASEEGVVPIDDEFVHAQEDVADDEDIDDDPPEDDEDDDNGEREPVPDDLELEVPDEAQMIIAAKEAAEAAGELRDFNLARRVARQDGYAVAPVFEGVVQSERDWAARRQIIFDELMAKHEEAKGKRAGKRATDQLWNQAAAQAFEEAQGGGQGDVSDVGGSRRVSKRARRKRN